MLTSATVATAPRAITLVSHVTLDAAPAVPARHSDQFAHQHLTPPNFQQADLLLASLYDASQNAERVAMKLDYVATALRRQLICCDSAISWLSNLDLLDYVHHPAFSYEAVQ
jgi:hypothetical protein